MNISSEAIAIALTSLAIIGVGLEIARVVEILGTAVNLESQAQSTRELEKTTKSS